MPTNSGMPAAYRLDVDHPLRWGVIGTGNIARKVMSDLLLIPDAQLAAVCSRSGDRGAAFADGLTLPDGRPRPELAVFQQVADMLPEIDVLYVATPHRMHHESAIAALESGTAVLVEKAMAVHYRHAAAMVDSARANRTFLMEAIWTRFNPLHVELRAMIAAGTLGDVRRVIDDFSFVFPYDPGHRLYDPAQGGGALLDLGAYPVSMIQSLLGDPERVTVVGSRAPNGVDDDATLLFGYPAGVAGVGTAGMLANGSNTASVVGTAGRVEIDANALAPTRMTLYRDGDEPEVHTRAIEGSGYVPQLREVQARVRNGEIESPVIPHRDSLEIMRILTDALDALGVRLP